MLTIICNRTELLKYLNAETFSGRVEDEVLDINQTGSPDYEIDLEPEFGEPESFTLRCVLGEYADVQAYWTETYPVTSKRLEFMIQALELDGKTACAKRKEGCV